MQKQKYSTKYRVVYIYSLSQLQCFDISDISVQEQKSCRSQTLTHVIIMNSYIHAVLIISLRLLSQGPARIKISIFPPDIL